MCFQPQIPGASVVDLDSLNPNPDSVPAFEVNADPGFDDQKF